VRHGEVGVDQRALLTDLVEHEAHPERQLPSLTANDTHAVLPSAATPTFTSLTRRLAGQPAPNAAPGSWVPVARPVRSLASPPPPVTVNTALGR
jgi:hypothetical protein